MPCPVGAPQRRGSPAPRSPRKPSGAVSGRSEPWRRTPNPLAQSAKAPPPQSLLSERRPDAADNVAERCRAGASLGGEHQKPLAHSAKAPPFQSLLSERRPDAAEHRPPKTRAERCRAGASLGGEHPTPSRKARKFILPRAYSANGGLMPRSPAHQNPSGAVSGRSEPWRRTPQPPRAQRESSSSPEPTQRPEA